MADWWVAVKMPFSVSEGFYSYVHPDGWRPGLHLSLERGVFRLTSFEDVRVAAEMIQDHS